MEIEKIFKNLILADFIVIILMVIASMYQPDEISNIYKNLNDGLLSNFENFSRILSIILFFLYLFTLNLLYRFISYGKNLYLFLVADCFTRRGVHWWINQWCDLNSFIFFTN